MKAGHGYFAVRTVTARCYYRIARISSRNRIDGEQIINADIIGKRKGTVKKRLPVAGNSVQGIGRGPAKMEIAVQDDGISLSEPVEADDAVGFYHRCFRMDR